jgi:hypothetical protein
LVLGTEFAEAGIPQSDMPARISEFLNDSSHSDDIACQKICLRLRSERRSDFGLAIHMRSKSDRCNSCMVASNDFVNR